MILSIVVPFYNEEAAIAGVLGRCCAAADALAKGPHGFLEVEVIAVDDGSSDGSAALAGKVPGVRLVRHVDNRGYGAAIMSGFAAARGDWLAFLDGDGTCDPASFAALMSKAAADELDVVLGARLHGGSRMPGYRAFGNRLFGTLLGLFGARGSFDVASGIRVLRRTAYERMVPLPEGMSFTPAMSARALLDPALRLGEVPVPYDERVGDSKLAPLRDGLRFARVILEAALVYRPGRLFGWAAAGLFLLAAALFVLRLGGPAAPLGHLLREGRAEAWMHFRFILIAVCASSAAFLAALGLLAQVLVGVVHRDRGGELAGPGAAGALVRWLPLGGALSFAAGVLVNAPALASYARTGQISGDYWTLPIVGGVLTGVGIQLVGFWAAARIAGLLRARERSRVKCYNPPE
ncbi:MAG: glycosyltransferase family 2 protein [Elusimicrobia bacterium]|nr:glycosyltransferase family 2 protein [Elusimicrobiota bacterium]